MYSTQIIYFQIKHTGYERIASLFRIIYDSGWWERHRQRSEVLFRPCCLRGRLSGYMTNLTFTISEFCTRLQCICSPLLPMPNITLRAGSVGSGVLFNISEQDGAHLVISIFQILVVSKDREVGRGKLFRLGRVSFDKFKVEDFFTLNRVMRGSTSSGWRHYNRKEKVTL